MAIEVGSAFVSVVPSTRGFGRNLGNQIGGDVDRVGRDAGSRFGGTFAAAGLGGMAGLSGGLGAALGVGAIAAGLGSAITKAGEFDRTIRTVGQTTGLTGAELKGLQQLALDMGASTTFSAQGAADAMLELAKAGLSAKDIGVAIKDTLTLAAAGGLELGDAAGYMVQGMTQFGLSAQDAPAIAAAFAGAANASTASVQSIGQALSAVGPTAKLAGLSLQETTGILALFDNNALKGSDAGTSLKTMLANLSPQTDKAAQAMADLGLDFTDAAGNFIPIAQVAEQLRQKLGPLNEEARNNALKTMFGSDAIRGAGILMEAGAAGVAKFTAATSDLNAANALAAVGTQGFAGAMEQFRGAVETAQIQLGLALLPAATAVLNFLTSAIPKLQAAGRAFLDLVGPPVVAAWQALQPAVAALFASFTGGGGMAALAGVGQALGGFVTAVMPTLISFAQQFLAIAGPAFATIANLITTQLLPALQRFLPVIQPIATFLLTVFGSALIGAFQGIVALVQGVITTISGILNLFTALLTGNWSAAWAAVKQIVSGALQGILGFIQIWLNVGLLGIFRQGFGLIAAVFTGGWAAIKTGITSAFTGMNAAVSAGIQGVLGVFRTLPAQIGGIFSTAGTWLFNAGRSIVQGLINGAKSLLSTIGKFFIDSLPAFIREPFRQAMGIQSPSKVMYEMGTQVSAGLVEGIISGKSDVQGSVSSLVPGQVRAPRLSGSGATAPGAGMTSTTSWLSGASITVQAQDPAQMQRALEARARLDALVGV